MFNCKNMDIVKVLFYLTQAIRNCVDRTMQMSDCSVSLLFAFTEWFLKHVPNSGDGAQKLNWYK